MFTSLNKLPVSYFITHGCGHSDYAIQSGSYHLALFEAGINDCNLRNASSIIPDGATQREKPTSFVRGEVMDSIVSKCHGEKGERISAGIIVADLKLRTNGKKKGGLVCEFGEKISEKELKEKLAVILDELYQISYADKYELDNIQIYTDSCKVTKKHGTALVALCFLEHQYQFNATHKSFPAFLGFKSAYETSKYVIQPVNFDRGSTWKKGTAEAASAILEASQHLESYDIETDSQAYKSGIHTATPYATTEQPEVMVNELTPIAEKLFKDGKIPCFIGGDHSISIAAFYALKTQVPNVSILQLDAHADLRPSFDGSPYNHACVMRRAKECSDNVVQCGIRSMSNREKTQFDPEKMFFAEDIHHSNLWVDDVIEELGDNVYITLDMSVFDPSFMATGIPEPDGLNYSQVLKLLKKVAKTRNVIGFDIVELSPFPGNYAPQFMAAKLIYQFISYLEAFKSSAVRSIANSKAQ